MEAAEAVEEEVVVEAAAEEVEEEQAVVKAAAEEVEEEQAVVEVCCWPAPRGGPACR